MATTVLLDEIIGEPSNVTAMLPYNVSNVLGNTSDNITVIDEVMEDPRLGELRHQLLYTRIVVQLILCPIVVSFGVVGNIMNIIVLTRPWMRSSTNYYLTALAFYDVMFLLLGLFQSFNHYSSVKNSSWYIYYNSPVGRPLADICSNSTVWLTLTFTVERYIGVCLPMKGKLWCTPERARYIIAVICLIVLIITFPEFFQFRVTGEFDPVSNTTKVVRHTTEFAKRTSYTVGYVYINMALFTFIPLVMLLVFNSLLVNAVLYAARQRRDNLCTVRTDNQQRQQREQQITVMLISVVMVFLVCQLPQAITNLYMAYMMATNPSPGMVLRYRLLIVGNVCNLLVMINSSCNFILYSSFSTKFRCTFRRIFCRCLHKTPNRRDFYSETMTMTMTTGQTCARSMDNLQQKKHSVCSETSTGLNPRSRLCQTGGQSPIAVSRDPPAKTQWINNGVNSDHGRWEQYPNLVRPLPKRKNGYFEVQDNSDSVDTSL